MAKKDKNIRPKTIQDENGQTYPVNVLDRDIVERHFIVEDIMQKVIEKEKELLELKAWAFETIESYLQTIAGKYKTNWQGNASLMNFPKTMQVTFKKNKLLAFDERLNIAKQKIDECLNRWSDNAQPELKILVTKAFDVDKEGNVDVTQILSLKQFKFKDKTWQEAMDIIDMALTVKKTKEYLNFAVRSDPKKEFRTVILNFASLEVENESAIQT